MKTLIRFFAVSAVLLSGCVDVPVEQLPQSGAVRLRGAELDPGAKNYETVHFNVKAYSPEKAQQFSESAEKIYQAIMNETGLYSFMPREPYEIMVYSDSAEFHSKTGLPAWSAGATFKNAIAIYESSRQESVLAHEMTHLIFNEYLQRNDNKLRWLNEGLAMHMEMQYMTQDEKWQTLAYTRDKITTAPIDFATMFRFVPASEQEHMINAWYLQTASVVGFMIERGGRMGFAAFLSKLKEGLELDQALEQAYPATWRNSAELETAWKKSLNII